MTRGSLVPEIPTYLFSRDHHHHFSNRCIQLHQELMCLEAEIVFERHFKYPFRWPDQKAPVYFPSKRVDNLSSETT